MPAFGRGIALTSVDATAVLKRDGIYQPADHGYKAWTWDPAFFAGSSTPLTTAGTVYVSRITLPVDAPITNIVTYVGTGGGTLTSGQCFASLWPASGSAVIGVTADQSGTWNTSGVKTMALASGPFTCTAADYYVAAFFNGTTGPSFLRINGNAGSMANVGLAQGSYRAARTDTGRTTTFPSSLGAQTVDIGPFWFALS